ncbi:S16 family serine protease [Verrucomicrobium sp. BvORR106]|uniref:S16 family serine protease n=1 Tax=Verrucomicrobium sp. BvORR106 TaxID=1403819 RepID=UPI00056FDC20|nr:S16 family serine protease [Verrucomicrobium sp. BvORR106]
MLPRPRFSHLAPGLLAAAIALGFQPAWVHGQSPAVTAPAKLSAMQEAEFAKWLVGTQWESERQGRIKTYWFVTPTFVIWTAGRESGHSVGFGYRVTGKGSVFWNFEPRKEASPNKMTVAEDLVSGSLNNGTDDLPLKYLGRRTPPALETQTTTAEFEKWLLAQELQGGGTIAVGDDRHLTWNGDRSRGEYRTIVPGIVECEWHNALDRSLLIFSPHQDSYQWYSSWGQASGPVVASANGASGAPVRTMTPPTSADPSQQGVALKRRSASVGGLLVVPLGGSRYAGKTSQLSISALKLDYGGPATVAFNQEVGPSMTTALDEVVKFHAVRHDGALRDHRMELSFDDKYSPKDGPSAAVACALLLESLVTGVELDPGFSVTGDMNADGSVQPIGGVIAKLRGASRAGQQITAIPLKNRTSAVDLALGEGITPFLGVQLFSIGQFDEALALARRDRAPEISKAMVAYSILSDQLRGNPALLTTPATKKTLGEIAAAAPNHVAARLLLAISEGRMPRQLSAAGSLEAVDQIVAAIKDATRLDLTTTSSLDGGEVAGVRNRLQRVRALLDSRLHPYVDAWTEWTTLADQIITRRSATAQMLAQFKAAGQRIGAEAQKLEGNSEFMEEIMK